MENEASRKSLLVYSYLELRTAIGLLGIGLPVIVALGGALIFRVGLQSSLSSYYHTGMRDVLVGTLFVIGFFLLSYKGYDRADNLTGNLACVFAVGLALFPTAPEVAPTIHDQIINLIHLIFAALFFLSLIYFLLYLFTKTYPDEPPTPQKLKRNQIYRVAGIVMIVCLLIMIAFTLSPDLGGSGVRALKPIFWAEAVATFSFGIAWFTKGGAIWKDQL